MSVLDDVLAPMASVFAFPEPLQRDSLDALADAQPNPFNATLSVLLSRSRATRGGPLLTLLRDPGA
ncbi:hypothetical protein BH20ACT4_BH20ACT4_12580 [soil metagenome]